MNNLMTYLLLSPFVLQGFVMFFDEFYYHHKRGLPAWEILGHPLDSITVFSCFYFLNSRMYSHDNLIIFVFLAFFSCVFVTKDELVHYKLCTAGEMWLHGLLFILHPLTFTSAAYIWWLKANTHDPMASQVEINLLIEVLKAQPFVVALFTIYQIMYWGISWKKVLKSITLSMTR